jgi:hypothetical protein
MEDPTSVAMAEQSDGHDAKMVVVEEEEVEIHLQTLRQRLGLHRRSP